MEWKLSESIHRKICNDKRINIYENLKTVKSKINNDCKNIILLNQIHSNKFVFINKNYKKKKKFKADAIITNQKKLPIGILTADCVPVLLADRDNGVIGAAHAGWRGANGGILESTVNMMCANGATLASIEAVIGPAIAKSSYQVGDDCRDAVVTAHADAMQFFTVDPKAPEKYLFDLPAFTAWQLGRIGLTDYVDLAIDTYDSANNLFSHRRATHAQLPDTGRQIAVIGLTS